MGDMGKPAAAIRKLLQSTHHESPALRVVVIQLNKLLIFLMVNSTYLRNVHRSVKILRNIAVRFCSGIFNKRYRFGISSGMILASMRQRAAFWTHPI